MFHPFLLTILSFLGSGYLLAADQTRAINTPVVTLPRGETTRILSPNRKWTLVFECPDECKERRLWIEENASHSRKLVKEYERSLDVSWAPDSHLFFVNDASGSTKTRSYIYEAGSLKETDLAQVVLAQDPSAAQFLNSGHSFLEAKRWNNSQELLVILEGHNDGKTPEAFTAVYDVGVTGRVRKLSQHLETDAVWFWFGGCRNGTPMGLKITVEEQTVHHLTFRACRMERSDANTNKEKKITVFQFSGGRTLHDTNQGEKIEGNIWQAGADSDDIVLGVSLIAHGQILLNTVHIVRPGKSTQSTLDRDIVIKTYPLKSSTDPSRAD
jgi:hypothetical protein